MSVTETKKESCTCRVCKRMRWLLTLAKTENDKKFVESVLDDLEASETDAVYWKMKYKGEWPSNDRMVEQFAKDGKSLDKTESSSEHVGLSYNAPLPRRRSIR